MLQILPVTELEELQGIFSDYYKSLHGIRPRFGGPEHWNSVEWLKEQIASLDAIAPSIYADEAAVERANIEKFEEFVRQTIESGAKDRETAIRWLKQATEDEFVINGSDDHFEYVSGLPYGYLKKNP